MKNFFNGKYSKEKVSRFFDKEGFYIVLFLCVCIVAITAVWVSRTGLKNTKNLSEVKDNKTVIDTPSKQISSSEDQQKPVIAVNNEAKVSKVDDISKSSKLNDMKEAIGTPAKTTPIVPILSLSSPVKEELIEDCIGLDYSPEDLVYFDALNEWRTHMGLDLKAIEGTEVLAAFGGKVGDVRDDNDGVGGLGFTVVINHNNGYQSVYSNLDQNIIVKKNDTVKKGQTIGNVGKSSVVEITMQNDVPVVSHLHFEVQKMNAKKYENVDPKKYLSMQQ